MPTEEWRTEQWRAQQRRAEQRRYEQGPSEQRPAQNPAQQSVQTAQIVPPKFCTQLQVRYRCTHLKGGTFVKCATHANTDLHCPARKMVYVEHPFNHLMYAVPAGGVTMGRFRLLASSFGIPLLGSLVAGQR